MTGANFLISGDVMHHTENTKELHRILVVDDDHMAGHMMEELLTSEGYPSLLCDNPNNAIEIAEREDFQLAFIDIEMPEMSGLDLAAKIKQKLPDCEVVFITGHGSIDNAIKAIKIGAYDFLMKPFEIYELQLCLRRFQERQELKKKIRLAEQRYFRLVQNIPSIVFIIRNDFKLEFINRACETILGLAPDEAMKNPEWLMGRIHDDDLNRIKNLFGKAFQSPDSNFSAECRMIHMDGHTLHVMIGSIALAEPEMTGGADHIQGIIVDITDRIFSERAVIQREKLKLLASISAEVAHGIRNPLVSIGGFARRLRKRFTELPEGDIILKESERLENMVKRIAEYLKPVEINYCECSINDVIAEAANNVAAEIAGKGLRCELKLSPALSLATVDRDMLVRIFTSLIRNAEKEMDSGGIIEIRSYETGHSRHIEFKNSYAKGKTRDPEPFFLPFNTGDKEDGLSLCYRLLKNMGGLLSYSHGEKETVFTVTLPKEATA
jgi:two-component system, NtrC family, sensor histidine kinase HydH